MSDGEGARRRWGRAPLAANVASLSLATPALSEQPVVDTATATEQAKQLVKSGAISAIKAETKNSGFKRSRTLEGKLKVSTSGVAGGTLGPESSLPHGKGSGFRETITGTQG